MPHVHRAPIVLAFGLLAAACSIGSVDAPTVSTELSAVELLDPAYPAVGLFEGTDKAWVENCYGVLVAPRVVFAHDYCTGSAVTFVGPSGEKSYDIIYTTDHGRLLRPESDHWNIYLSAHILAEPVDGIEPAEVAPLEDGERYVALDPRASATWRAAPIAVSLADQVPEESSWGWALGTRIGGNTCLPHVRKEVAFREDVFGPVMVEGENRVAGIGWDWRVNYSLDGSIPYAGAPFGDQECVFRMMNLSHENVRSFLDEVMAFLPCVEPTAANREIGMECMTRRSGIDSFGRLRDRPGHGDLGNGETGVWMLPAYANAADATSWTFRVPESGYYAIEAHVPNRDGCSDPEPEVCSGYEAVECERPLCSNELSRHANYEFRLQGEVWKDLHTEIDQRIAQAGSGWAYLGSYDLRQSRTQQILLSAETMDESGGDQLLVGDRIRLRRIDPPVEKLSEPVWVGKSHDYQWSHDTSLTYGGRRIVTVYPGRLAIGVRLTATVTDADGNETAVCSPTTAGGFGEEYAPPASRCVADIPPGGNLHVALRGYGETWARVVITREAD